MRYDTYSLKKLLSALTDQFDGVSEVYLFGSRLHRTRSTRSDVDLLITVSDSVIAEDVRDLALRECPALDFFLIEGGVATSCANGSKVRASNKKSLIKSLGAKKIWDKSAGFLPVDIDWDFDVVKGMNPMMTTLISAVPFPSKAEAVSEGAAIESTINESMWSKAKDHPIWVLAVAVCAAAAITFKVTYELRIVPLEKEIERLKVTLTSEHNNIPENAPNKSKQQSPSGGTR